MTAHTATLLTAAVGYHQKRKNSYTMPPTAAAARCRWSVADCEIRTSSGAVSPARKSHACAVLYVVSGLPTGVQ
jgi:hypothetical protein